MPMRHTLTRASALVHQVRRDNRYRQQYAKAAHDGQFHPRRSVRRSLAVRKKRHHNDDQAIAQVHV
jgi:hypothetical protein